MPPMRHPQNSFMTWHTRLITKNRYNAKSEYDDWRNQAALVHLKR